MAMVTDFHSHILPGIDDGSETLEESLAMLRMERDQGIRRVLATPHFYARHDFPETFLTRRNRAEALLRREMEREPGLPELLVGAEVSYFRGMSESEYLPQLAIRGTKAILIEMPLGPWPKEAFRELEAIWERRQIRPIIAHIDRYIQPFGMDQLPRKLARLPVLVQANASFFLRWTTSSLAMKLLKADQIQLLGSDCHDLSGRKPDLGPAMERIRRKLGQEVLDRIGRYEEAILCK